MFYTLRYDFTPERLAMAKASAERALELQPGLPEGHEALGAYHYWGFRDYKHAIEQFEIASEKLPVHNKLCYVYRRQGRWNDALEELVRWRRIDPQAFFVAFEASAMQQDLRDYKKAEEEAKRAIAIGPNQPDAYIMGARIYVLWDGATDRARRLLESAPSQESPAFAHLWIQLDLYDRKPEMALARLQDAAIDASRSVVGYLPRGWLRCVCLSEMGEVNAAAEACESAVEQLKLETEARPYDYDAYSALGRAYALLDRSEEAVRAGEHAVELVPISKDVIDGAAVAVELAKIYTGVGETDKALDLIEDLLSIPCDLSVGLLRLDPVWDPLRDHPRFQALLERHDERSNVETLER